MPKRIDRNARRNELLDAAVRVFAQKGFAASRVEDVATEAGTGKGTVYLYFASRDAILRAVFDSYAERTSAALKSLPPGPPLERLAELIRATITALAQHRDHAAVLLDLWRASPGLDMASVYRDHRAAIVSLLDEARVRDEIRTGIDDRHAAVIVGALEGSLIQWLVDPEIDLEQLANPIIAVCVEGIRT
ncbi:transcriptional regulator, TetR family [Brevibacterium aurantiacum]|uniref:Transcriptional regulator, TetR family n=1 Tax=Brevibacterium aurantiacum TaxID=273384 RepID=A0A2H1J8N9_BREAU|nr:TetR/AcrR family transcriptional regulator [Brevibacterium aurantiacum]SMX83753.1 transcriptional regulator, TetR family [Brevibacterium aurantiacum]